MPLRRTAPMGIQSFPSSSSVLLRRAKKLTNMLFQNELLPLFPAKEKR